MTLLSSILTHVVTLVLSLYLLPMYVPLQFVWMIEHIN